MFERELSAALARNHRVYQAAVALVSTSIGSGAATVGADLSTPFDLASLTKLFTTYAVLNADARGWLDIDGNVLAWVPEWDAAEGMALTPRDLLAHRTGLPAAPHSGTPGLPWPEKDAEQFAADPWTTVFALPLHPPERGRAVYSDVGYMILGRILERSTGVQIENAFQQLVVEPLGLQRVSFGSSDSAPASGADAAGVVHDPAARLLGGLGGHAGVFASAPAVLHLVAALHRGEGIGRERAQEALRLHSITAQGGGFGLGWMFPAVTDPATRALSARRVGHNGFTGTSAWIDPHRDMTVVLLTNRISAGASAAQIRQLRAEIHAAAVRSFDTHRQRGLAT